MQALTPLLFAMLFPRFSKNDTHSDAEGHDTIESLLGGHRNSTSSEVASPSFFSFGEGYPVDEYSQDNRAAAKARRHHSTGALLDSAQTNNNNAGSPRNTNIRRNNTVPQVRRTSRPQPQRLSIDHAAFIATYPSLDGLGDMGYRSSSSLDYYRNNNNTANTANNNPSTTPRTPRSKASSSKLRKAQSQETLPSRSSTSSIASMVSDASSISSVSSAREPLTPTKASNYHSILSNDGTDASSSKKSKRASLPVAIVNSQKNDLINPDSVAQDENNIFQAKSPMVCQSPQSDNFFSAEESFAGPVASVNSEGFVKARGQRQLIAH
ncbi:hypothetical protein EC991_009118 [Linnemannia zychae]|nr:hypothetical protein EC991_009118 [Linnemannia zychae]